jgi:hypothetical protein
MANPLALLRTDFPEYHITTMSHDGGAGPQMVRGYEAYKNGTDGKTDGPFIASARTVDELRHKLQAIRDAPRSQATSKARRMTEGRRRGRFAPVN